LRTFEAHIVQIFLSLVIKVSSFLRWKGGSQDNALLRHVLHCHSYVDQRLVALRLTLSGGVQLTIKLPAYYKSSVFYNHPF
jgi:hypothetical protein